MWVIRLVFILTGVVVVVVVVDLFSVERGLRLVSAPHIELELVPASYVRGDGSEYWPVCAAHSVAVGVSGVNGRARVDQSDPLVSCVSENMLHTVSCSHDCRSGIVSVESCDGGNYSIYTWCYYRLGCGWLLLMG